jgi:hypothetical protein
LAQERVKRNEKLVSVKGISDQEFEELQNAVSGLQAERDMILARLPRQKYERPSMASSDENGE